MVAFGLVVVGGTRVNSGFVGGANLWLWLFLFVGVVACLTGCFLSHFGVLLNFFFTFSNLLQPFMVFTFSFSNLFFILVNFDMKISFSFFFSWGKGVVGFGCFGWVGVSCLLILFLNLKPSKNFLIGAGVVFLFSELFGVSGG